MKSNSSQSFGVRRPTFTWVLLGLFLLAWAVPAFAAGRVVWKSTSVQEREDTESWRLDIEIHLPRAPDVAHIPMKFEFVPVAHYERSLNDGQEKPQTRTIPLTGQQTLIESVDVGFLDSGSGEIQSRTRFSFRLTRAHGYEAGEYKTTIRDSRTGQQVGTTTQLKLQGENAVIDRRSMVFQPNEKKKKAEKTEPAPTAAATTSAPEEPEETEEPVSEAPTAADAGQTPPSVEERPGGGCQIHPAASGSFPAVLVAFALLFSLRRRSLA